MVVGHQQYYRTSSWTSRPGVTNRRSGSGPRSRPVRTRTYSQNRRFWFITWRGASICNRRSFCSLYGSGLANEETHRPIACELSHPTWYYSANQVCAFQAVNIATLQCRESERQVTHEKTVEINRQRAIQVEKTKGEKQRIETEKRRETGVRQRKGEKRRSETEKGRETGVRQRKLRNRKLRNRSETEKVEKQRSEGEKQRSETEKGRETWGTNGALQKKKRGQRK